MSPEVASHSRAFPFRQNVERAGSDGGDFGRGIAMCQGPVGQGPSSVREEIVKNYPKAEPEQQCKI